jgi:ABC-type phosphate transport system permease subunit
MQKVTVAQKKTFTKRIGECFLMLKAVLLTIYFFFAVVFLAVVSWPLLISVGI